METWGRSATLFMRRVSLLLAVVLVVLTPITSLNADPPIRAPAVVDLGDYDVAHLPPIAAPLLPGNDALGGLLAAIEARLAGEDPETGVAIEVTTPQGGALVSWDGSHLYSAASVMKLAILATYEDAIAHGDLPRDAENDRTEEEMIVFSDNDAANALIDLLGRARINALMQRLGMAHSSLGSHFDIAYDDDEGDNYLTPRETITLLTALLDGRVGDTARIRDLLGRSEAPGSVRQAFMDAHVPYPVYEKRGWYDGVENDALRIDIGPNAVTIAVFQPDVTDEEAAWSLFTDLAWLTMAAVGSSE